ncbi:hypothetical protein [Microcystis phage MaeS]|nr:hypothetical protein [Microcystis phage MaeS]
MAKSGNFGTSNGNVWYYIEAIQNSQSIAGNYSNVTVRVYFQRTSGYSTYGTGTVYCKINGTTYSASVSSSQKITSTPIKLFEKTLNISHDSNGTKTLGMSAWISLDNPLTSSEQSWSMGLTTIARTSKPTLSASTTAMNAAVTIYTNRADSGFTHTLKYKFGSASGTIATGVGTSYGWTIPLTLANQIPSATSGSGSITCETYSGSTLIGSEQVTFTATVPSTVVPTFTAVSASEANSAVTTAAIGSYVQGISKANLAVTGQAGAYGSWITDVKITLDGKTYNNNTVSSVITSSGTLTVTGKITDSRGRTASKSITITVLAYAPPKITTLTIDRANSDGTLNDMGTYAKVTRAGSWSNLNSKNNVTITVFSSPRGANTWTSKNAATGTITAGTYSGSVTVGTYVATSSFDFKVEVKDAFNTTISFIALPTGIVTMSWAPEGIGVGKVWESGTLDVEGQVSASSFTSWNPSNKSATVSLNWLNNIARIRYGGNGDGSAGGFQIVGPSELVKFSVDNNGNGTFGGAGLTVGGKSAEIVNSEGSNTNGWYIRYESGLQICFYYGSSLGTDHSWGQLTRGGGIYYYVATTWTYPAAFKTGENVKVFKSGDLPGAGPETHTAFAGSPTSCSIEFGMYGISPATSGTCRDTRLAIGYWK